MEPQMLPTIVVESMILAMLAREKKYYTISQLSNVFHLLTARRMLQVIMLIRKYLIYLSPQSSLPFNSYTASSASL